MAPQEVIDLTQPEVIELDTDGEEVTTDAPPNGSASTQTPQDNDAQQPGKKKRKKRRRKAGAQAGEDEQGGSTTTSTGVSRPQSPNSQDEPEIVEVVKSVERVQEEGNSRSGKRSLEDRLQESGQDVVDGEERRRRDKREKGKERRRDEERGKGRDRDRPRDRDRRRSRSPRRDRDRDRDREPRRRSRSRDHDRNRERRERDGASRRDVLLFFEDVTPTEIPARDRLPISVAGPSRLPAQTGSTTTASTDGQADNGLLLPAHVSVAEGAEAEALELGPLKVPTPELDLDEEDYIDYLDYDDNVKVWLVPCLCRFDS